MPISWIIYGMINCSMITDMLIAAILTQLNIYTVVVEQTDVCVQNFLIVDWGTFLVRVNILKPGSK